MTHRHLLQIQSSKGKISGNNSFYLEKFINITGTEKTKTPKTVKRVPTYSKAVTYEIFSWGGRRRGPISFSLFGSLLLYYPLYLNRCFYYNKYTHHTCIHNYIYILVYTIMRNI